MRLVISTPSPHLFSELRILKDLRGRVFVTAHSKEVSRRNCGTAHSKGLVRADRWHLTIDSMEQEEESPHAPAVDAGNEGRKLDLGKKFLEESPPPPGILRKEFGND